MTSAFRISYSERNMKYFTPPTTFDILWMEFGQSIHHMKTLLLDFFLALSKLFRTLSHVLAALWEGLELVAYFLLSLINLIWLLMKVILLLGEQIKAMGPGGPSQAQNPNYYKKEYEQSRSFKGNYGTSESTSSQHGPSHELRSITKVVGNPVSETNKGTESKAIPEEIGQSPVKKRAEQSNSTIKEAEQKYTLKEEPLHSTREDSRLYNTHLLNPTKTSIFTDLDKDDKKDQGKNDPVPSGLPTLISESNLNARATRSSSYYRYRSSESQRMSSPGHVSAVINDRLIKKDSFH